MSDYFILLAICQSLIYVILQHSSIQANNHAKFESNFFDADACLWESWLKVFEIAKKQLSDGL